MIVGTNHGGNSLDLRLGLVEEGQQVPVRFDARGTPDGPLRGLKRIA